MNVIITGSSRGIGVELCRAALKNKHRVLAVARRATKSIALQELKRDHASQLSITDVDLTENGFENKITDAVRDWTQIDILVNNAGILDENVTEAALMNSFRINSVAPLLLTNACLQKLKQSANPVVAQITSRMGSISESSGGYYGYRASKAALNMFNKCLAADHPWLTTMVLHPGWVKTDMGGKSAPVEPSESARGLWQIIEKAKSKTHSGRFLDFTGKEIAW